MGLYINTSRLFTLRESRFYKEIEDFTNSQLFKNLRFISLNYILYERLKFCANNHTNQYFRTLCTSYIRNSHSQLYPISASRGARSPNPRQPLFRSTKFDMGDGLDGDTLRRQLRKDSETHRQQTNQKNDGGRQRIDLSFRSS